jgi:23S rRNA (adenine2503-C2)-methyltransferase
VKLLVAFTDGSRVETVLIPARDRATLCVSTQTGCARACVFCATARMGPGRNLSAGEILEQAVMAERYQASGASMASGASEAGHAQRCVAPMAGRKAPDIRAGTGLKPAPGGAQAERYLSNVVFMGMGEPLDNYDNVRKAVILLAEPKAFGIGARKITISTSGVVPGIRRMADDGLPARLTVSLGAPEDGMRDRLMPINRKWPLADLAAACEYYRDRTRRPVTIAYALLGGINDTPEMAERLARFANRVGAKVNLIACNPGRGFTRPPEGDIRRFQEILVENGVLALLRRERGGDISGACGQLAVGP